MEIKSHDVSVRGFAAAKTANFHACGDDDDEEAKSWPPEGSPEEAKSGRLVASDKSLSFEGRRLHNTQAAGSRPPPHTHIYIIMRHLSLCSFIIIIVVPAVSINAIQAAVQLRRPLAHSLYWANIKTPGGISGCVCRGCRSGRHTRRALNCSLSMSKWATLTELHVVWLGAGRITCVYMCES